MATAKVGQKKSLFKKPAWASTSSKATNETEPIFGQAHLYQEIVQVEKERREKHAAKQRERAAKEREQAEQRESKRRRISKEAEDNDSHSDNDMRSTRSGSADSQRSHTDTTPENEEETKQNRSTPQKPKTRLVEQSRSKRSPQTRSQTKRSQAQDRTIILEDDDPQPNQEQESSDLYGTIQSTSTGLSTKTKQAEPESESDEEDEYIRELKLKARQEARSKRLGIDVEKAKASYSLSAQSPPDVRSPSNTDSVSPQRNARSASAPNGDDEPEVKIWIKTIIPGAREVIVNRKIGQPLDKVKDFWIKRNELDPGLAAKVFFTWNGTRLYNSTTMRGIIERLKRTHPTADGGDPSNGRITIEAVTDEIFEYAQNQRARRLAEAEGQPTVDDDQQINTHDPSANTQSNNDTDPGENTAAAAAAATKAGIVIKLKAQGIEDTSIRVRPNTTMRKILAGFCAVRGISQDMQCWLSYDGDRLEPDNTVEDVGFEHEDTVEVYLRS